MAIPASSQVRRRMRRWLFRGLAIALGLLPLLLIEIGLRAFGSSPTQLTADPFVEFTEVRPLFALNSAGDKFEIPASRQPYFKPDSFVATKPANGFRIFCLGGSTVQGNPYSIETAFTTWLELSLEAAAPDRAWEVINCGGISYASYRLEPILRECLNYQPDLFVLYVGDNEFLEERSFARSRHVAEWSPGLWKTFARSHLFQLARHQWMTWREERPTASAAALQAEVDALLDYEGGLAQYHRDPALRAAVAQHFEFALHSMLAHAKAAKIPVLVLDPVSNVKDCPPFKVEVDPQLSSANRELLVKLLIDAQGADDPERKLELLENAGQLDTGHAGVHFERGRTLLQQGRDSEARTALFEAKDNDVCPLRMTEPLREILYVVSQKTKTPVVPVLRAFSERSPHGIPGDEWLLDHVHPTISGHQLIAEMLLHEMQTQGWVTLGTDWEAKRQQLYKEHLRTLDAPYYARGQEHLEGLRRWASGRITKIRQRP